MSEDFTSSGGENPCFPAGMRTPCTAFKESRLIAAGDLSQVVRTAKEYVDAHGDEDSVLIFNDVTGQVLEVEYKGTTDEVVRRLTFGVGKGASDPVEPRQGGPKLGVAACEVTLLPRHWEWLNAQPGGASVALRRLVEDARQADSNRAQGACYRVMSMLQDDWPGYSEAMSALSQKSQERFDAAVEAWPSDVRDYARKLAQTAIRVMRGD